MQCSVRLQLQKLVHVIRYPHRNFVKSKIAAIKGYGSKTIGLIDSENVGLAIRMNSSSFSVQDIERSS